MGYILDLSGVKRIYEKDLGEVYKNTDDMYHYAIYCIDITRKGICKGRA